MLASYRLALRGEAKADLAAALGYPSGAAHPARVERLQSAGRHHSGELLSLNKFEVNRLCPPRTCRREEEGLWLRTVRSQEGGGDCGREGGRSGSSAPRGGSGPRGPRGHLVRDLPCEATPQFARDSLMHSEATDSPVP